jgi:hypothetical protein
VEGEAEKGEAGLVGRDGAEGEAARAPRPTQTTARLPVLPRQVRRCAVRLPIRHSVLHPGLRAPCPLRPAQRPRLLSPGHVVGHLPRHHPPHLLQRLHDGRRRLYGDAPPARHRAAAPAWAQDTCWAGCLALGVCAALRRLRVASHHRRSDRRGEAPQHASGGFPPQWKASGTSDMSLGAVVTTCRQGLASPEPDRQCMGRRGHSHCCGTPPKPWQTRTRALPYAPHTPARTRNALPWSA